MFILRVFLTSILSVIVLFLLTKLIGFRQVSEMSMLDYVNSITIGSIAADLAISEEKNTFISLVAMAVFGFSTFFLSLITNKSMKIRKLVESSPIVIMEGGKLYFESLKKAHMDLSEFLENCRISGYFDISSLHTVILEANGKMSFIPKTSEKPITIGDYMKIDNNGFVNQTTLSPPVILDGKIMKKPLQRMGYNENWLYKELAKKDVKDISTVFLATSTDDGKLNVFIKSKEKAQNKLEI